MTVVHLQFGDHTLMKTEEDLWICSCGNTSEADGFEKFPPPGTIITMDAYDEKGRVFPIHFHVTEYFWLCKRCKSLYNDGGYCIGRNPEL